ncbi:hypothetical protein EDD15DRAFT_2200894 [Pisolithus albus]|nr:hypothetical protein EDD15DRAFT_2200894 [Pisolithus albus]
MAFPAGAGTVAFMLRAGLNEILASLRLGRVPKDMRLVQICCDVGQVINNPTSSSRSPRLTQFTGSFVALYKFTLNALPILLPQPSEPPPFPFGDSEDESVPVTPDPIIPHHHNDGAGWCACWKSRYHVRETLAADSDSSAAVRTEPVPPSHPSGLQGSYNAFTSKNGFHIPHGEALLFCIWYVILLSNASGASRQAIKMVRDMNLNRTFDVQDIDKILQRSVVHFKPFDLIPANRTAVLAARALASGEPPDFGLYPPILSESPDTTVMTVFKWAFPIYGALHFLPMILFKRKAFLLKPIHMLGKAGVGTIRSSAFLAAFVASFQSWVCLKHYIYEVLSSQKTLKLPKSIINFFVSKYSYAFGGFLEERRRRGELAVYALPKAMESAWLTARGKGWAFRTGSAGEALRWVWLW